MSNRWITIYTAPIYQLAGIQGQLEEAGIQTFVPDSNLKLIDPFILGGGNALDAELMVPEIAQEPAELIIASYLDDIGKENSYNEDPESVWESVEMRDLDRMGRRTRWATVMGFLPISIYWGCRYLSRTRLLTEKPARHNWTWFALVWSIGGSLGLSVLQWHLW